VGPVIGGELIRMSWSNVNLLVAVAVRAGCGIRRDVAADGLGLTHLTRRCRHRAFSFADILTPRRCSMLQNSDVSTRIPARDLVRARAFYSTKLGLEPVEERPGGLRYKCGSGYFTLFQSSGSASGTHTQMAWEVNDIQATVSELRRRGVTFEEYDVPGLKTINGIAEI
jgi:predicted enzyme related to lactoylglutathione lyase